MNKNLSDAEKLFVEDIKHAITEAKNQTIVWVVGFQLGFSGMVIAIMKLLEK